jgi:2-methylcitrate dehydratase PrpD
MADLMIDLVKNIVSTDYEKLTPESIAYAKESILDTIGAIIAGSTGQGCREVVELVKDWGGKKESTILIYGDKVPCATAGLAIGPMARARDIGDVEESGPAGHITEYILPVAFPVSELRGSVTGKEFITAVALAQDIMVRLGCSIIKPPDWPRYTETRIFGPTAVAAKLLLLDEETTLNAMGIAFSQLCGEKQCYKDGALTVRVEHGFIANDAIRSVQLARKGITGAKNILQGEHGFYAAFEPNYSLTPVVSGLGKRFDGVKVSIKPYSSCKFGHGAINATLNIVKKYDVSAENIDKIDVAVGPMAYRFICEPKEVKNNPRNIVDCQFSAAYVVANAIVKRKVFIDDFALEAINRTDVRELINKVNTRIEPDLVTSDNAIGGSVVTIRTKDGKEYSEKVLYVKGNPKNPMTYEEIAEKFRMCMLFSAKPIHKENVERIIELVRNLENVSNMNQVIGLLS